MDLILHCKCGVQSRVMPEQFDPSVTGLICGSCNKIYQKIDLIPKHELETPKSMADVEIQMQMNSTYHDFNIKPTISEESIRKNMLNIVRGLFIYYESASTRQEIYFGRQNSEYILSIGTKPWFKGSSLADLFTLIMTNYSSDAFLKAYDEEENIKCYDILKLINEKHTVWKISRGDIWGDSWKFLIEIDSDKHTNYWSIFTKNKLECFNNFHELLKKIDEEK